MEERKLIQIPIEEEIEESESCSGGYTTNTSQNSPLYNNDSYNHNNNGINKHKAKTKNKNRRKSMPNLNQRRNRRKNNKNNNINNNNNYSDDDDQNEMASTPSKRRLGTVEEEEKDQENDKENIENIENIENEGQNVGSINRSALLNQCLQQNDDDPRKKKKSILPVKTLRFDDDLESPAPPSILNTQRKNRNRENQNHKTPNLGDIHNGLNALSILHKNKKKNVVDINTNPSPLIDTNQSNNNDNEMNETRNNSSSLSIDSELITKSRQSSYHRKKMTKSLTTTNQMLSSGLDDTMKRLKEALPSPIPIQTEPQQKQEDEEEEEEEEQQQQQQEQQRTRKKPLKKRRSARLKSTNRALIIRLMMMRIKIYQIRTKDPIKRVSKTRHKTKRNHQKQK